MRSIAVVLCVLALHSATAKRNENRTNRKRRRRRNLQEYKDVSDPIYPDNCVQNGTELLQNLREYYINGRSASVAAMNYGHPIQSWCVGPEVEDKLRKSNGMLRDQVSTAVEMNTKDTFDPFDAADANKLMEDWIVSASEQDCVELCGVLDGHFADSFGEEETAMETQEKQKDKDEGDDDQTIWSEEYEYMERSFDSNERDFELKEEIISHIEEETTTTSNATATATATTIAPPAVSPVSISPPAVTPVSIAPPAATPVSIDEEDELEEEQILVEENNENNEDYYSIQNNQEWDVEDEQYQQEETAPMDNESNASNENNQNYYSIQNNQEWEEEEDRGRPITIEDFDITSNENSPTSIAQERPTAISRNETTSAMLFRLIPLKLCALLASMCLVLGLRQMILNSDRDHWCGKIGALLGFRSGRQAAYQGIDPSDVEASQKSVEFELLQLAASGDDAFADEDLDVDIGTDIFDDISFSNNSDE